MMIIEPIMLQNMCVSSVSSFLTSPYTAWLPIVMIGVVLVLVILAIIYAISPLIGRSDLKTWTRLKMYETLFSLVLVLAFGVFSTWLCTTNPQGAFNAIGLVPSGTLPNQINCISSASNFYSLSECDLYNFNNVILGNLNNMVGLLLVGVNSPPTKPFSFEDVFGVRDLGVSFTLSLDPSMSTLAMSALTAIISMYILNDLQLILLDSSLIIFAVFLAIGLIARVFGISRSFGGSMIALGVGIGFVLPLLVSISYGFIDSSWNSNFYQALLNTNPFSGIINLIMNLLTGSQSVGSAFVSGFFGPLISLTGISVIGALFLPILDFVVVDAFVLDFSQAIGERVDFMSLLQSVI